MYLSIDSKLQINVDLTVAMKCESKFLLLKYIHVNLRLIALYFYNCTTFTLNTSYEFVLKLLVFIIYFIYNKYSQFIDYSK